LVHSSDGLLTGLTDARSGIHRFEYESDGRLKKDTDPVGGFKALSKSAFTAPYTVSVSTALNRTTQYTVLSQPGSRRVHVVTATDGTESRTTYVGDTQQATLSADGSTSTPSLSPDPPFGHNAPIPSLTWRAPSGLQWQMSGSRSATLSVSTDPMSLQSLSEVASINGRQWRADYAASTRTWTYRSPAGRQRTATLDASGRVVRTTTPGLADVTYSYDAQGRLQSVQQGTRIASVPFGTDGRPATSTDALNRTTTYTRDAIGRVKTAQLPASRMVAFTYDPNGNLSTLTPPGQPTHQFGYTLEDIVNVYTPPTVTSPPASPIGTQSTSSGYNLDGNLTGVTLPDSRTIVPTYDAFGRLDTVQTARTTVRMHYAADTGQLVSITDALASGTSPTGASVAITHDGPLFTSASWSGAVTGSVSYAYNADLLVTTTTVPGTPAATNGYDTDLLLTSITID